MQWPFMLKSTHSRLIDEQRETHDLELAEAARNNKTLKAKLTLERRKTSDLLQDVQQLARKLKAATNRSNLVAEAVEDIFKYLQSADAPETGTPQTYIAWLRFKLGAYLP